MAKYRIREMLGFGRVEYYIVQERVYLLFWKTIKDLHKAERRFWFLEEAEDYIRRQG